MRFGKTTAKILPAISREWAGQGWCKSCGRELLRKTIYTLGGFNAFTGEHLGKEMTVLYCDELFVGYMGDFPAYDATGLWMHRDDPELRRYQKHDFWFYA